MKAIWLAWLKDLRRRLAGEDGWARIGRVLSRHVALRLLSLGLAIALWLFVNTAQHQSEIQLEVPISYHSLPAGLAIINRYPGFIKLDVSGPRTLLSLLDPGRMTLRLDLSGVNPGQASFRISPEMFSVPRQTSITRVMPSQIVLDIDRVVKLELPVKLNLEGKVATGYEIAQTELKPAQVTVTGPSRFVSYLKRINTETFTVQGASSDVDAVVNLVDPGPRARLAEKAVEVRIALREVIGDREFKGIKVQVRDTDHKVRIQPPKANITVRGPLRKLSKLNLAGAVFVDADGVAPGSHVVEVQIDLPDGVDLVRQTPHKVKLTVYMEKRSSSG